MCGHQRRGTHAAPSSNIECTTCQVHCVPISKARGGSLEHRQHTLVSHLVSEPAQDAVFAQVDMNDCASAMPALARCSPLKETNEHGGGHEHRGNSCALIKARQAGMTLEGGMTEHTVCTMASFLKGGQQHGCLRKPACARCAWRRQVQDARGNRCHAYMHPSEQFDRTRRTSAGADTRDSAPQLNWQRQHGEETHNTGASWLRKHSLRNGKHVLDVCGELLAVPLQEKVAIWR
jgi:hypothetical protein